MASALALIGGVQIWKGRIIGFGLIVLALGFLITTAFAPTAMEPLKVRWTALGHRLSVVSSFVILVLTFYLVFAPIGVMARLFGIDLLNLKLKPKSSSYWSAVDPEPGLRPDRPY
jgi:Saxitoxin biosynthesis operon protein SxtJ